MTMATTTPATAGRLPGFLRPGPFWLAVPGLAFILVFFLIPTVDMMSVSLFDKAGDLTLATYARITASSVYLRVLNTTFSVALQVTLWCLLLGYPLAYWLSGMPGRRQRIMLMFVLLPYWTSALVKNFAWLVLLGRNGIVSAVMEKAGLPGGDSLLFSRATVIFAMVHTMLPLAVVTMMPIMNQIDRRLTMAAETLGASGAQAFWQVFFPLSARGVATAGLLVFVSSLGFFITPALVGGARDTMISQLIITQINQLQNWQFGSALAVMLVAASLLTIFLYDRLFGLSSIAGESKRGSADGRLRRLGLRLTGGLGRFFAKWEAFTRRNLRGLSGSGLLAFYGWAVIAVLLFPVVGVVPMAFTEAEFLSFPPVGFSFRWFEAYLDSPVWVSATLRSFGIGFATAFITVAVAGLAALGLARSKSRFAGVAFLIFMAPMVVPPIVIAISLFYLFASLSMIATDSAIAIGHSVIALPIVFVILLATFKEHDWRLDQAAATLGASRLQVARRVTLPMVKAGLVVGFVTGFLQSFEELTVALFIGGGLKTTLPKQMWDDITLSANPRIAAASVCVLLVVMILFAAIEYVQRPRGGTARR
ncbi:ABC transporter permease subunit [Rhizobiaceae bacterium BDR2-2]|uniref:ABC transporter permease subunit n=1 Tax=Ectorhizobium quercum TaxID=2965071 RepID=A0AAE3N1G0_9HYPH|nr:ABC transporter permease subunit [Ectorhizobium quercum]MCX8997934.1 ABC transporter permease subunit [Ectorhizobium quercum]